MTTREMLRKVLLSIYIDKQHADYLYLNKPDSDMFFGMRAQSDRTFSLGREMSLNNDYILWRYSPYYWEKFSEVLNCEEE